MRRDRLEFCQSISTAGSITLSPNQGGVLKKVDTNRWIYMGDNKTSWA
jgi:hypothetical protein